jgi:hypothetical protein
VRSKLALMAVGVLASVSALASLPANRRTILTTGETVYPIHYQLGQSTVISFGFKPETVICGNKNYFNIERIKEGITIQPLSSFSTNLTVISGEKRFLFYLTPSGRLQPDGLIDVKWVPPSEVTAFKQVAPMTDVKTLSASISLAPGVSLTLADLLSSSVGGPSIIDFNLKNESGEIVLTSELQVFVASNRQAMKGQTTVWEQDSVSTRASIKGRVIFASQNERSLSLIVRYKMQTKKISLKDMGH